MNIKINCKYFYDGAYCTNKLIKRSLFGIGARVCIEHPYDKKKCDIKEMIPRPIAPPPPPQKRRI